MGNEYESLRNENIEKNNEFLRSLHLPFMRSNVVEGATKQKRKTRLTNNSTEEPQNRPNLRPSKTLKQILRDGDNINQDDEVVVCTGGHPMEEALDINSGQPKKSNTRGYTQKQKIWSRGNKDKLTIQANDLGQPIGKNATEFANFIGTIVRCKGFPISYPDWRLVPLNKKMKIVEDLKLFYEVDEDLYDWVLATTAKKWKDFKSDLKKEFMNKISKGLSNHAQFHDIRDDRITDDDWDWLVKHWSSEEAQARSNRGKSNRSKVSTLHTAGSKSFARVGHEMKALQDLAEAQPELKEKDINEGDIFSHVFGKEKKGHVRGLGLGPTPHSLEMPGFRKYTSTKVQIALEGRRKVEEENSRLRDEMERMRKENDEMKKLIQASQPTPSVLNADMSIGEDEQSEGGSFIADSIVPLVHEVFTQKRVPSKMNDKCGKEVILCSIMRPYDIVAKGTIQTTNPEDMVGDRKLGHECFGIVIDYVIKRDAMLLRPYGKVKTLLDAKARCIAWPINRIQDNEKIVQPSKVK